MSKAKLKKHLLSLTKEQITNIDKIETFMGQTLVTVTYTQPDALSGFGGCFVDVHITKQ